MGHFEAKASASKRGHHIPAVFGPTRVATYIQYQTIVVGWIVA